MHRAMRGPGNVPWMSLSCTGEGLCKRTARSHASPLVRLERKLCASSTVVYGLQWSMSLTLRIVVVVRSSRSGLHSAAIGLSPACSHLLTVKDAHIDGCMVADQLPLWSTVARCISDGVYVVNYGDLVPHLLVCVAAAFPTERWGRYRVRGAPRRLYSSAAACANRTASWVIVIARKNRITVRFVKSRLADGQIGRHLGVHRVGLRDLLQLDAATCGRHPRVPWLCGCSLLQCGWFLAVQLCCAR